MKNSSELYKIYSDLHTEVIKTLKKTIGNKKVNLEDLEDEFEDDSHNTVVKIDKNKVYTDGTFGEYPISDLTIPDALYILRIIEK